MVSTDSVTDKKKIVEERRKIYEGLKWDNEVKLGPKELVIEN